MRTGRFFVPALVALTITATVSHAQQMRIAVYGDPVVECDFNLGPAFSVGTAHVIVKSSVPFASVRFRAPVPACNGIVFLSDTAPIGIAPTGNSQTGVSVTLPGCTSVTSGVEVMQISYFLTTAGTDVCQWTVEPYPGDTDIMLTDCDGYEAKAAGNGAGWMNGGGTCGLVGENNWIAGYRPSPVNGAPSVAVNSQLDWVGPANVIWLANHPFDVPIAGHDHWNDDIVFYPTLPGGPYAPPQPFDPGPLAPYTTYHWRIAYFYLFGYEGGEAYSDEWSFTTEGPVAVEASTWGAVKALYR